MDTLYYVITNIILLRVTIKKKVFRGSEGYSVNDTVQQITKTFKNNPDQEHVDRGNLGNKGHTWPSARSTDTRANQERAHKVSSFHGRKMLIADWCARWSSKYNTM